MWFPVCFTAYILVGKKQEAADDKMMDDGEGAPPQQQQQDWNIGELGLLCLTVDVSYHNYPNYSHHRSLLYLS